MDITSKVENENNEIKIGDSSPMYQISLPSRDLIQKAKPISRMKPAKSANMLDGTTWLRYSISIWSDIKKTGEEIALGHPAIFPFALVSRLIQCFTNQDDKIVLDPFVGIGSTAIAAEALGKIGIGIEISEEFAQKARSRPLSPELNNKYISSGERIIHTGNAKDLLQYVRPNSVDLVITSPPYWDILLQERTADYKAIRHYGNAQNDLGKIRDYPLFLSSLKEIFASVFKALKPRKYCCIIVMDLRKKDKFYPLHIDVAAFMQEIGFIFDDIVVWDRRQEYNNIRPLGYPFKFRVNKTHEYILIFQKPYQGES